MHKACKNNPRMTRAGLRSANLVKYTVKDCRVCQNYVCEHYFENDFVHGKDCGATRRKN